MSSQATSAISSLPCREMSAHDSGGQSTGVGAACDQAVAPSNCPMPTGEAGRAFAAQIRKKGSRCVSVVCAAASLQCDVQIQSVVRRNNARAARKALLILRRQAVTVLERAFIHHRQQRLLWLATALLPVWRRYNTARKQVLWHAVGKQLAVARTTGEAAARRRHKAMSTLVRAFTRMVVRAKVARAVAAAARRKTMAARRIHAVWWRHRFLRMRRRAAARQRRTATTTVHKVVRRFIRRVRADIAVRRFWWGRVNAEFEAMLAHFKATKESRYVGKLTAHLQQFHQPRTCCGR